MQQGKGSHSFGYIDPSQRAVFGNGYAAEPDQLIKELSQDESIYEADKVMLAIPNILELDHNAHV